MIYRARSSKAVSAWITDKRGAFSHGGEMVCPGFHLYRGFVGCPAWRDGKPCTYCFLRTTFRHDPDLLKGVCWVGDVLDCTECSIHEDVERDRDHCEINCPHPVGPHSGLHNARAAVKKWLRTTIDPYLRPGITKRVKVLGRPTSRTAMVLNPGELADSLGFSPQENPHIGMLLDLFSDPATNPHGHEVMMLTKAGEEGAFLHVAGRKPSENVILSWSIGDRADLEPISMPIGFMGRLSAATIARSLGWRVRWRLDPLHEGTAGEHAYTCAELTAQCRDKRGDPDRMPELITLGTLRHRGGRVKLPVEERINIYRAAIEGLRDGGYEGPIGLCKETAAVIREVLGIEPGEMKCNCMP